MEGDENQNIQTTETISEGIPEKTSEKVDETNKMLSRLDKIENALSQLIEENEKLTNERNSYKSKYEDAEKTIKTNTEKHKKEIEKLNDQIKNEEVMRASGRPVESIPIVDNLIEAATDALFMGTTGGQVPFTEEGRKKAAAYIRESIMKDYNTIVMRR